MAYTLGNKCAKNLCKQIVLLKLIIENVVTCFFGTQCIWICARDWQWHVPPTGSLLICACVCGCREERQQQFVPVVPYVERGAANKNNRNRH